MLSIKTVRDGMKLISYIKKFESQNHPDYSIREEYKKKITPKINKFSEENGNTPERLLKEFLKTYLLFNRNRLKFKLNLQDIPFGYQNRKFKVYDFCWSTIILSNEDESSKTYRFSPQLVLSLTKDGINCSFSYGGGVSNKSEFVQKVKENIPNLISKFDIENVVFRIRKSDPYIEYKLKDKAIEFLNDDLKSKWNRDCQLISTISPDSLTTQEMNEKIISELDKYVLFFIEAVSAK